VLLTATPAGEALYERRGFVDQDTMLQFVLNDCALRPDISDQVAPMRTDDLAEVAALDTPIFGANRSVVLAAYLAGYPSRAFVVRDAGGRISGYLFAQVETIGPWVAGDRDSAEALLTAALQLQFEPAPRVLIPGANSSGSALLQRYGFSPQRTLRHMRRGRDASPTHRELLYGQASFTVG
jgi:GNAT acetyltransferase-like protein